MRTLWMVTGIHALGSGFRKAHFLAVASYRVTASPGSIPASTRPGKPAPEPRSAKVLASAGIRGASWAQSQICRCHRSSRVRRPPGYAGHSSRPACRHRPSAGPMFHVKHRSSPGTPRVRTDQALFAFWPFTWARTRVRAAAVTPSMRAAWPKVAGRMRSSFCRTSLESRSRRHNPGQRAGRGLRPGGRR